VKITLTQNDRTGRKEKERGGVSRGPSQNLKKTGGEEPIRDSNETVRVDREKEGAQVTAREKFWPLRPRGKGMKGGGKVKEVSEGIKK